MPPRDTAVVIVGWQQFPALVLLARDLGLACLALRIQRVEVLFQTILGTFAGVDGAADPAHQVMRWS